MQVEWWGMQRSDDDEQEEACRGAGSPSATGRTGEAEWTRPDLFIQSLATLPTLPTLPLSVEPRDLGASRSTEPTDRALEEVLDEILQKDNQGPTRGANCPQCGRHFLRSYDLRRHVRQTHQRIRPFKCTICDKNFARNAHLESHRRKRHPKAEQSEATKSEKPAVDKS